MKIADIPCRRCFQVKRFEPNMRAVRAHQALTGSIGDRKPRDPANKIPSKKKTGARAPAFSIQELPFWETATARRSTGARFLITAG
jgi:hypothetical protein